MAHGGPITKRRLIEGLVLGAVFLGAAFVGCRFYRKEVAQYGVRGYLRELRKKSPEFIEQDVLRRAWHPLTDPHKTPEKALTPEQREALERLKALGYLDGYEKAPELIGVTRYDKTKACDGLNFYVSGHGPEALLIDMDGNVLHTWHYDFWDIWPDYPKDNDRVDFHHWRRAHLFPNGDVLAIFNAMGLLKIDRDSNLIWVYTAGCHHDICVTDTGDIYVLAEESKMMPRYHPTHPLIEDFVVLLDVEGNERRRVSLLRCFEQSSYAATLDRMESCGDVFHTNTIEIFDGRLADKSPLFQKGHALVSVRQLDAVAIVDLEAERVVWALSGMWHMQHQPALLDSGNILLFDNQGFHGRSKVIEFDPFTQRVVWMYGGDASNDFYSELSGSCQRLPNGNTLISESNRGRAFEVTPENEVVWEFFNPHRAGEDGQLIGTLFELVRIPKDYLQPL